MDFFFVWFSLVLVLLLYIGGFFQYLVLPLMLVKFIFWDLCFLGGPILQFQQLTILSFPLKWEKIVIKNTCNFNWRYCDKSFNGMFFIQLKYSIGMIQCPVLAPSRRKILINWSAFSTEQPQWSGPGALTLKADYEGASLDQSGEELSLGRRNNSPGNSEEVVKRMKPGSSQWCVVRRQVKMK